MPSSVACACVCSMVQQCCSTSYETASGRCILNKRTSPETETADNSNVMMKIPDSISNHQPKDCSDLPPCTKSGVFEIYPDGTNKIDLYCDMDTAGGGWTVAVGPMGNDNLHILTKARNYVMRFEMQDFENNTAYAEEYQSFRVNNEASKYTVSFTGYMGTAGNGFENNNGMKFTTRDRDNDLHMYHCGLGQQGAWWYNACSQSTLNGIYKPEGTTGAKIIYWKTWRNTTLKATGMKIRPIN
ncbi:unnamed protein product [Mytilus coruscus]|uniref:Fibrinogen C-terminal domain-containing protein n=1 Tax=Mytilus coruscus TaxID=42192 RepID=A0A6J7ZW65_MYTCO|nr:unnamed protein product [Mytilus coruscus]